MQYNPANQFLVDYTGFNPVFNPQEIGTLVAQVNPTYPIGDPRYGTPIMTNVGAPSRKEIPLSLTGPQFKSVVIQQALPEEQQKIIKGMQTPSGWGPPPPGYIVPPGL